MMGKAFSSTKFSLIAHALTMPPIASAAVGDVVSGNGSYIAEGISVSSIGTGYLQTSRANSSRLYDSTKGAEWAVTSSSTKKQDSEMCWLHAASNAIQYWQSYYGVFAKPQTGSYYDYDASFNSGFLETDKTKPLPYGRIGTEAPSSSDSSTENVPDGRRLEVARDMYLSIPNTEKQPRNEGGYFSWACEWFFRGADQWPDTDGTKDLTAGGQAPNTGGYYANYFGTGTHFKQDLSYTTVFSASREAMSSVQDSTTGVPFADDDAAAVKNLLLQGFGVKDGLQMESGLITCIGTNNSDTGNGHVLTCYGFTTNSDGTLKSILIADNNDDINNFNSSLKELFIKVQNNRIELYEDSLYTDAFSTTGGVNYITAVSYINTPDVLKNMLTEYSDVTNEAQVWNGGNEEWSIQKATTEELPTTSTGWDIHVDGDNIAQEHRDYYHTYSTEGRDVLFSDHAAADKRRVAVTGAVKAQNIEVTAEGYSFTKGTNGSISAVSGGGSLNIRSGGSLSSEVSLDGRDVLIEDSALLELTYATSIELGDLTMQGNARLSTVENTTVKVTGNFTATPLPAPQATTYTMRSNPTVLEPSIHAHLDLTEAESITLATSVNMNGYDIILSNDTPITLQLAAGSEEVPFFTNIGTLTIGGETITNGTSLTSVLNITNAADFAGYNIIYAGGNISLIIPEPATATLSMLALAALATRRRRK